jgi:hypothetical protein
MSLENLIKINQLQRHAATADEVQRLLAAANRNLADSGVAGLSDRGRERFWPSPPSEPGVQFSRDGLSSQLFPHRD